MSCGIIACIRASAAAASRTRPAARSRRNVRRAAAKASSPASAIAASIGVAVPSKNGPASAIITPPVSICSVPPSDEASPAMSGCGSSAITIVVGITSPRKALPTKSMAMITGRLPNPASVSSEERRGDRREGRRPPSPTTRAMPKRSPSDAAICEAPKKPIALSAKARLKPVGDSPNCSV